MNNTSVVQMGPDSHTLDGISEDVISQDDLDTWKRREEIAKEQIPGEKPRRLALDYLEHLAMGGRTKVFLVDRGVTWWHMSEFYAGVMKPVYKVAKALGGVVRFRLAEDELYRRGVEGVDKPVFHKGEVCGYVKEYSDSMLAMYLKAADPDKYAERNKVEHRGAILHLHTDGMR